MIQINTNTIIYRPVRQVFDFLCTPENDFQWQYDTLVSSRLSEKAPRQGLFSEALDT